MVERGEECLREKSSSQHPHLQVRTQISQELQWLAQLEELGSTYSLIFGPGLLEKIIY